MIYNFISCSLTSIFLIIILFYVLQKCEYLRFLNESQYQTGLIIFQKEGS